MEFGLLLFKRRFSKISVFFCVNKSPKLRDVFGKGFPITTQGGGISLVLCNWLRSWKLNILNKFTKKVTYNFLKTSISDLDGITIWQDLGFKLDKKQASKLVGKAAGYQNRLFISKLRRKVEKNI